MSVLLSAYYPEGIVFAADKNATLKTSSGTRKYVEATATKVLAWPNQKAIVGFVGLGELAKLKLDEWMRIFIAGTRNFNDIEELSNLLKGNIQNDFEKDYPKTSNFNYPNLIIHLGGFTIKDKIPVPVMFHIWNHGDIVQGMKDYPPGERTFRLSEDIERDFKMWPHPEDYPTRVRERLQNMVNERIFLWYNNGANIGAFNYFKGIIWESLKELDDHGFVPNSYGLNKRIAYCKMAVEVFGSFFTHHFDPADRIVGGGVDVVSIPWPS